MDFGFDALQYKKYLLCLDDITLASEERIMTQIMDCCELGSMSDVLIDCYQALEEECVNRFLRFADVQDALSSCGNGVGDGTSPQRTRDMVIPVFDE